MDKSAIIEAIKQIAEANGGKPPGRTTFESQTGIRMAEWYPHFWVRWGDALMEAGYSANKFQAAIGSDVLIEKYIGLARELKHLPVHGELRRQGQLDKTFPSHSVFGRLGGKVKLVEAALRYCKERSGYDDIIALCQNHSTTVKPVDNLERPTKVRTGFVYLMKSGRHYKIGRTDCLGARERQLAIKIPIPPRTIHSIETDDPVGVEAYWHNRFADKRGEGEWFDLSPEDVQAFKRWKRIA